MIIIFFFELTILILYFKIIYIDLKEIYNALMYQFMFGFFLFVFRFFITT